MKRVGCPFVLVILLALNSCVSYRNSSMEVLRPPVTYSSTANGKLLLINNCIPQPPYAGQFFAGLNSEGRDTSYTISCEVDTFVDLLQGYITARIKSEGVLRSVDTVTVSSNGIGKKVGSKAYLRIDSLDDSQRAQLRKLYDASCWVCLDGLLVESVASQRNDGEKYPQMRRVFVRTFWRVYDASTDSLLLAFKQRDSLTWRTTGLVLGVMDKSMPTLKETLPEIADYVAGNIYRVFTPYWESIERFYYVSGNLQLKLGGDEVVAGNWDGAAVYWKNAYEKGNGLNQFRASVNMMLYNERVGNVQEALVWAERAKEANDRSIFHVPIFELDAFKAWKKDLLYRQKEMELLKPYLGGFVE